MTGFTPYLPKSHDEPLAEFGTVKLYTTGITLDNNASRDDWRNALRYAESRHKSSAWWFGDLQLAGDYYDWMSDFADGTLDNAKWVCNKVAPSRRREELSFDHHATVARLEPAEQIAELQFAIDNQVKSKAFRAHIAAKYADGNQPVERVICRLMPARVLGVDYDNGSVNLQLEGAELIEFARLIKDGKVRVTLSAVDDDPDTDQ